MTLAAAVPPARAIGFVEWFRIGEHERVSEAVAGMRRAGATQLRTHLSWAEYHTPEGQGWYDWLIPVLGRAFDLLPCVHYTPPSLSRTGHVSGPPIRLQDYPDFIDHVLTRYGSHFTHLELWNEPNNLLDWDWREDHDWLLFCEMAGAAAHWIKHRGWHAVLGGPSPFDVYWLDLMGRRGLLAEVAAVGFHGFPGTWDSEVASWQGYDVHLAEVRQVLDRWNPVSEVWITEAGYATWRHDEAQQVERFREAMAAPADRFYWYGWQDIPRTTAVQEGVYFDPRHYHLGVTDAGGRPKLLRRLLEAGRTDLFASNRSRVAAPQVIRPASPIVIIGGAGFIGSNLADDLLRDGEEVVVFDSLARPGVERNLSWLEGRYTKRLHACIGDIRDADLVGEVVHRAKAVFHLAAQVAVTSSLADPALDFAVNAQGTFNVLEAIRHKAPSAAFVFASTNKVYGSLEDVALIEIGGRHLPADHAIRAHGVDETRPLDFCTPYGCSKGAADQYVLDYAKSFGLRSAVLRMSCIYGPRQFGTEDQGWVAHFLIRALENRPITIYGDGRQVRDILHVRDAVAAYRAVLKAIDQVRGMAFNLGGGPFNAVSLNTVLSEIATLVDHELMVGHEAWRPGDQLYFVADTGRLCAAVGWHAGIAWRDGLKDLADWARQQLDLPSLQGSDRPPQQRMRA